MIIAYKLTLYKAPFEDKNLRTGGRNKKKVKTVIRYPPPCLSESLHH